LLIGIVGFIASGKDTVADYLVENRQFYRDSFAGTLKDAVSVIFGWDRTLLEGKTKESRAWREQVDEWWAARLKMPHLTPRFVLQNIGTNVLRDNFHEEIWIASLENKLRKTTTNTVISDVRFPNEIKSIQNSGGIVIRVKRGPEPEWFEDAKRLNIEKPGNFEWVMSKQKIDELGIHASETSWIGFPIDQIIENDGSIEDLHNKVQSILNNQA
jgi:hypothetical protein